MQNDVQTSADHLALSLLWSKTRIGGYPITCTGRKMHLWVTIGKRESLRTCLPSVVHLRPVGVNWLF